jgi:hypothetical protein
LFLTAAAAAAVGAEAVVAVAAADYRNRRALRQSIRW